MADQKSNRGTTVVSFLKTKKRNKMNLHHKFHHMRSPYGSLSEHEIFSGVWPIYASQAWSWSYSDCRPIPILFSWSAFSSHSLSQDQ